MNTRDIRQAFFDFQKKHGHTQIPRANVVPQDDPTTLFTGSGMQPLVPYLLGDNHPEGKRLVNSQTCLRAEDIDEVGDNRHTTFFEMLGNWSLGDYFKEDQLKHLFEFFVDVVGLDAGKLYVTCFMGDEQAGIPKDTQSAQTWQELFSTKKLDNIIVDVGSEADGGRLGMQDARIFYYDGSKNWWSRQGEPANMAPGEPGGPDSEVFYLFDDIEHDKSFGEYCHPNCDCGRFLEIGNSVFMQYIKRENGGFDELPRRNVDFGGGLERIAAAANDDADVFAISLLKPIIEQLEELSGKKYKDATEPMRIIADHIRAGVWLIVDGVMPSNNEQGYVVRRLLRRAIRAAHELGIEQNFLTQIAPVVIDAYAQDYAEVAQRRDVVLQALEKEEKAFRQTLRKGVREFTKLAEVNGLTGEVAFALYDTYGFPIELTEEEAKNSSIEIQANWRDEFDRLMQEQKERSRSATKGQFKGGLGGHSDIHKKYHTATHLMYRALREVLGDHVLQRGSNITEDRLRFDFEHPEKMTDEQKQQVEAIVNERIAMDLGVSFEELPTDEALEKGAYGAFGDKYGDTVKVYSMKDNSGHAYSFEICGGPHVDKTSELAEGGTVFEIAKEQSSSAGVRRIKAKLV